MFVVALLVLGAFAGLRGWICARAFARTLFSPMGKPTRLDATARPVDHVLCATELHTGEHAYFSGRFVCSYRFGFGRPGDLALHDAVHASAAYPGGFPARWFRASGHAFALLTNAPATRASWSWSTAAPTTTSGTSERWRYGRAIAAGPTSTGLNEPDELIVVNSSGPMDWGRLEHLRLPIIGEALILKRDVDVLYDTTTSTRRRSWPERSPSLALLRPGAESSM